MGLDTQSAAVANKHGIPYDLAYQITERLRTAAMKLIFKDVTEAEWRLLSTKQQASICTGVIKQLMSQKCVQDILSRG